MRAGIAKSYKKKSFPIDKKKDGPLDTLPFCKVRSICFENMDAFSEYKRKPVEVPELGRVEVDIAFGGMWYCIVDIEQFGAQLPVGPFAA